LSQQTHAITGAPRRDAASIEEVRRLTAQSEYALLHGGAWASRVNSATRRRLAHTFFAWTVLKWSDELGWARRQLPIDSIPELDATLLELTPAFSKAFTHKWGKLHARYTGASPCRPTGT